MALPTFRAAGAKVAGTTAGLAVTAPAGVATGDLEILVASTIAGGTCSISAAGGSAWTAMTGSPQDVTGGEKLYVWWRIRQAGDSDPSVSAASDHFLAARMAITTGTFDPTTPFELAQAGSETTSDTSFSFATTGSTAGADRLCFCICTSGFDSNTHQVPAMTNAQLGSLTGRFTNHNTSNGAGGGFGCTSGTKVVAGALGTFACTIVTASSKAYIAFAVRPIPPLLPDNETMIDDFNRADASVDAGAGATLWNAVNHRDGVATSNARVIGNQYGLLINDNTGIYSKFFMAADFDLTFDTPQVFPVPIEFCFCLQEVPGSTWDGYMIEFSNTGQWTLYRVTNDFADYALVQQVTGLTHANGDSWWIRVRGSSIKVYQKAAAGVYTLRIDTTDATYTGLTGPISFATYNTLGRIDNIRGGPVLAGPPPDVKSGTDAGVGDEAGAVPAMGMFGSEAGVLAEAGSTSVLITRTETGAGDDVQGRTSFLTVTDAAVGVELGLVILPPVIITGTDVGAGVDVAALLRTALAQDSALGAEIGGMSYIPLVSDAGAGLDFAGLAALLAAIDSGIETDIGSLVLSVVGFDTGLGSEFGSIPARVLLGRGCGTRCPPGLAIW